MSIKKSLKNKYGLSVLEVLVSLGVFSIVIFGLSQMIINSLKHQKDVNVESGYNDFVSNLSQLVNNSDTCTDILKGQPTSGTIKVFKPGTGQSQVLLEQGMELSGWKINKLELLNSTALAGNRKIGTLHIELDKKDANYSVVKSRKKDILIQLSETPGNKIESCWTQSNIAQSCLELGGTYDDTKTPPCSLQTVVTGQSCPSGQSVTGFDADGKIICVSNPVQTVYVTSTTAAATVTTTTTTTTAPTTIVATTTTTTTTAPTTAGCAGKSATCKLGNNGQVWATCDQNGFMSVRAYINYTFSRDTGWVAGTKTQIQVVVNKHAQRVTADASSFTTLRGGGDFGSCSAALQ